MIILYLMLYFVIGVEFLYPFTIRYYGFPQLPALSIQALILLLFTIIYLNSIISNKRLNIFSLGLKNYKYLFLIFGLNIMLSAFLNSNNILLVIKSIVSYSLIYIVLFLTILEMDLNEKGQENLIKFIFLLILIQIPVTLYQFLFMGYTTADYNSGTVASANAGGTGIIGILMMFFQAYIVASIMIKGFNIKRLLLILLTFIPIIVGGVRIGLILSPITIIITIGGYYLLSKNIDSKKYLRSIVTVGVLIGTMALVILVVIPNTKYAKFLDLETVTNANKFEEYNSSNVRYSRILPYTILFKYTFENDMNYILGKGNAEITQSSSANVNNTKLKNVTDYPDAVLILASNGILGLILVISILAAAIKTLKKYLRLEASEFMRIVAFAFIPVTFNVVVALFYTSAWESQICLAYWVILAVLLQRYSVLQNTKNLFLSLGRFSS